MPVTNRAQAKEGGFGQVRDALIEFEGDVLAEKFDKWPDRREEDGTTTPGKEYYEVTSINNKILQSTEELSMDIAANFTFRVNCSDYKGTFWIDDFLGAVDNLKVLIPGGFTGKHVRWRKFTHQAKNPLYNSTSFIPVSISDIVIAAPQTVVAPPNVVAAPATGVSSAPSVVAPPVAQTQPAPAPVQPAAPAGTDPMSIAISVAIGKTEEEFRNAIGLHQSFVNNPLLNLAKAGALTSALVHDNKLKLVQEGNRVVYRLP